MFGFVKFGCTKIDAVPINYGKIGSTLNWFHT